MPTYFQPSSIVQYAEYPDTNISWTNNSRDDTIITDEAYNFADPTTGQGDKNNLITVGSLSHVPNSFRGPKIDKTYYLKCTGFNMTNLPTVMTGFSLKLVTQRNARVVDETVCLIYNGEVVSDNKTNLSSIREGHIRNGNIQEYGGPTDMWGADITKEMMQDPEFGVLLRFSSNPLYPHRDSMIIYKIVFEIWSDEYFIYEERELEFILEDDPLTIFVPE
jgi:hypothetical protein